MRTLVDTCVLSEVHRKGGNPRVRERFEALATEDVFLSVLTLGELRKGISRLAEGAKKRSLDAWLEKILLVAADHILPLDIETALLWGEITARCETQGKPIPAVDGLVAATAIRHGLRLMTRNVVDFEATGVLLVNPWEETEA